MDKLFVLALFSILLLPFRFYLLDRDYRRIRAYLSKRGCETLDIVWQPNNLFASRSRGGSYEVVYVNAKNELYRARCFADHYSELFWTEATFLYMATPERLERLRSLSQTRTDEEPFTAKSEKEKVIDGLASVYKYERLWAVNTLSQMTSVDEQMLRLLETLAQLDEEPEVRAAAADTMNKLRILEEG